MTTPPLSITVTGATGRLGRLLRHPWRGRGVAWHGRADGALVPVLQARRCLVCLAGVVRGSRADLAANARIAVAALDAAAIAGVPRVLLFSSSAVYGRAHGPLGENRAITPATEYGRAKLDMERAVADWSAARPDGPQAVCLRLGNVAGADALLGRLGTDVPRLDIFDDGRGPRRNYIGPVTLAHVLERLALDDMPLPPVLNLGTPGLVDMADLLRAAGRDWIEVPAPDDALPEVALDTTRLQRMIPLDPATARPARLVAEWREAGT
ncbi:NAD-dependent epimerase/dehydratase family protein [Jannaschia sp. S6380]|uniref:NAD-dependent epimerase/dehydratase family protein n=1 Tax=Jannaschia sp. S6380 TaxID=2926408 RepID=UPI001FF39778|nr:NAD-dependent epimerase/dehydratase family protein [Jannaschia sp. S6380]